MLTIVCKWLSLFWYLKGDDYYLFTFLEVVLPVKNVYRHWKRLRKLIAAKADNSHEMPIKTGLLTKRAKHVSTKNIYQSGKNSDTDIWADILTICSDVKTNIFVMDQLSSDNHSRLINLDNQYINHAQDVCLTVSYHPKSIPRRPYFWLNYLLDKFNFQVGWLKISLFVCVCLESLFM